LQLLPQDTRYRQQIVELAFRHSKMPKRMGGGGRREVGGQMQPRNAAPEKKTCDANFEWRNVNATIENSSFYVFLVVAFC